MKIRITIEAECTRATLAAVLERQLTYAEFGKGATAVVMRQDEPEPYGVGQDEVEILSTQIDEVTP